MRVSSFRSFLTLQPYAKYCARQMGYELVGEGGAFELFSYRLFPRKLPFSEYKHLKDPYKEPFSVNINSVTSRIGFSYAEEGWHPFVQTLKEYAQNKNLKYEDSCLALLYQKFCPKNVQEVLLDHIKEPIVPFCDWPPVNDLLRWVWALNPPSARSYLQYAKQMEGEEGWIFFGPHSPEYGKKEFDRLLKVYDSIEAKGYQPKLAELDPVNGYFLKSEDDLRFVLLQGNHRVSALKVLGYSQIDAVIRKGHPAVIDGSDLRRWTKSFGGMYSSYLVQVLFNSLFTQTGTEKAHRLGLI